MFQEAETRLSKAPKGERCETDGKTVKFDLCVIGLMANIEDTTRNGVTERNFYKAVEHFMSTQ